MPNLWSSYAYARRSGQGRTQRGYGDSVVPGPIALINRVRDAGYAFLPKAHDSLVQIRGQARREMLAESRKHAASKLLGGIPRLGPIRVALLIALLQTPH